MAIIKDPRPEAAALRKLQTRYARESLKYPNDDFKAALKACNNQHPVAIELLRQVKHCPVVDQIKQDLLEEEGEDAFLPTKKEILNDMMHRADKAADSDYTNMMKTVLDALGYTSKAQPNTTVEITNTSINNKIMHIPQILTPEGTLISDDEWSKQCQDQQRKLVSHE